MKIAPVTLFTFNRPWHTRRTVEALLENDLADESELIVFSDGPRNYQDKHKIGEVRQYLNSISGFKKVSLIERPQNLGLGQSIINGVTEVLRDQEKIIVLEDDLITSPFFLRYMNDALEIYADEERVISIHGYIFPVAEILPPTFFLSGADCWGWATWKSVWDLFEEDGSNLLSELRKKNLTEEFNFNGAYRYTRMLKDQIKGRNTSWAVRWYASAFLRNRLTLYPGVSLIQHIGNDGTGTNFGKSDFLDVELAKGPLTVTAIELAENQEVRRIIGEYLHAIKTPFTKGLFNCGKKYLRRMLKSECGE